jgi:hypothetical protein
VLKDVLAILRLRVPDISGLYCDMQCINEYMEFTARLFGLASTLLDMVYTRKDRVKR